VVDFSQRAELSKVKGGDKLIIRCGLPVLLVVEEGDSLRYPKQVSYIAFLELFRERNGLLR